MELLRKKDWEASKVNLVANWQQASMALQMIEKQLLLCDERIAEFPEDEEKE